MPVSVPPSVAVASCRLMVTVAPLTGFPLPSATRTMTGGLITAPAGVLEGCCTKEIWPGAPVTLVSAKLALAATPIIPAVTE